LCLVHRIKNKLDENEGADAEGIKETLEETVAWVIANKQTATKSDITEKQNHLLRLCGAE